MGDLKEAGRIGARTLVYYEVVSTLALVIGMAGALLLRPGSGMQIHPAALDTREIAGYRVEATHGPASFIDSIVPASIGAAFVSGNMLPVVLLSILFGLGLAQFREQARPLLEVLELVLRACFGIVGFILLLAPLAIFGAIAFTVGQYGVATLIPLAKFVAAIWIVCAIFMATVLTVAAHLAGVNLWKLLGYIEEEIVITLGTSSSEAVMAPLMVKMEQLG